MIADTLLAWWHGSECNDIGKMDPCTKCEGLEVGDFDHRVVFVCNVLAYLYTSSSVKAITCQVEVVKELLDQRLVSSLQSRSSEQH